MAVLKLGKQRPNFGNGGEVDKIISRAISNFRKRFTKIPSDMRLAVSKEALLLEDDFDPEHLRSLHAKDEVDHQFGDLIGLDSQINVFRQLARQVKAMTKHKLDPKPSIPFTFIIKGPPGRGKTTRQPILSHGSASYQRSRGGLSARHARGIHRADCNSDPGIDRGLSVKFYSLMRHIV